MSTLENWFIPAVTPLCLASCVYLFEELEQEAGDKRIAQAIFVAACAVLAYVVLMHAQKSSVADVKMTLMFEVASIVVVGMKILQDAP